MLAAPALAADAFELKDGDRVVLVGGALIEREQRYGYWEAALTSRWPDRNITFRNLGWSGDNVWGDARAGFGTRADGFKLLKDHVLSLNPTVIVVAYGGNESFDGEKGLPTFVDGLNVLLDTLAPAKARIVLLAPLRLEKLAPPLPDPTAANKNIRLYTDAIRGVAKKRDLTFADLNEFLADGPDAAPLTDDGMHLTAYGYWVTTNALEMALGLPTDAPTLEVDAAKGPRFELTIPRLPPASLLDDSSTASSHTVNHVAPSATLKVKSLAPGSYRLAIDGEVRTTGLSGEKPLAAGLPIAQSPDIDQAEKLRQAIVAKNRLYFYRWRPANETYLFGFRKAEQGKNAVEIPEFDPLVAEKEKEIAKLRVPVPHTYELKPEAK